MTSEPERRPRWRESADAFRTWAPLVISVCAISLTFYQGAATRRHARLSVEPRLDWRIEVQDDTGDVRLTLVNVGFGPAVVSAIRLGYGDADFGAVGVPACRAMDRSIGREGDDWDTACFDAGAEYVLRAGDEALLYGSRAAAGLPEAARSARPVAYAQVRVAARYCSFYGDCWSLGEP